MTAEQFVGTQLFESVDVPRVLEELSRIYRWLLVTDARHRVVWVSDGLHGLPGIASLEIGDDAREFIENLPHPEQVFSLRTGAALDDEAVALRTYPVRVVHGMVRVGLPDPTTPL